MKKRFSLVLALLFGGFTISSSLYSCAESEYLTYETRGKVNNVQAGYIHFSKDSGLVGETVDVNIDVNDGYALTEVFVNGDKRQNCDTSFAFKPVTGKNIVSANYEKIIVPIDKKFNINLTYNEEKGSVILDKTNGDVGEIITATINPNPGFVVERILFNSEEVKLSDRSFSPVKGLNTLEVFFSEVVHEVHEWMISSSFNIGGNIILNTSTGKIGEKLIVEIVVEPEYSIEYIKFNNVEVNKGTRVFEPLEGENTLQVSFRKEKTIISLDQGYELENLEFNGTSDFTAKELSEYLYKIFIGNNIQNNFLTKYIENYPHILDVANKCNLTKASIEKTVKALSELLESEFDYTEIASVESAVNKIIKIYDSLSLEQFTGMLYLTSLPFYLDNRLNFNFERNGNNNFVSPDTEINRIIASFGDSTPQEVKDYYSTIYNDSDIENKNYKSVFNEENFKKFKIYTEFVYKTISKSLSITRDEKLLSSYIYNLIKLMNSNLDIKNVELDKITSAINFAGKLLSDEFISLNSFKKLFSAFDVLDDFSYLLNKSNSQNACDVNIYSKLSSKFLENFKHPESYYRIIKYIGTIAKDVTSNEVSFILDLIVSQNREKDLARKFVHMSRLILKSYTHFGLDALLIKEAFSTFTSDVTESSKDIFKSKYFISDGLTIYKPILEFNGTINFILRLSELDFDLLMNEAKEASEKDINSLVEEDNEYYKKFIEENIISCFDTITEDPYKYTFKGKSEYQIGDKLELEITKEENGKIEKIVIDDSKVPSFDTSKKRFGCFKFDINENLSFLFNYKVGLNSIKSVSFDGNSELIKGIPLEDIKISSDSTVIANGNDLIGLDINKCGVQRVYLFYLGHYYYKDVFVYDTKDVINKIYLNQTLPLNVELDLNTVLYKSLLTQGDYVTYDGVQTIVGESEQFNLDIKEVESINGSKGSKYILSEHMDNQITITYYNNLNNGLEELTIYLKGSDIVSREFKLEKNDKGFYNFKNSTREDNKKISFAATNKYVLENSENYLIEFYQELFPTDFKNSLRNDTLSTIDGDIVDYVNINGDEYLFRYTVYDLVEEKYNEYLITNDSAYKYFLKDSNNYFSYLKGVKGNLYIYKNIEGKELLDVHYYNDSEEIRLYDENSNGSLDTSTSGINYFQFSFYKGQEVMENVKFYYFVGYKTDKIYREISSSTPIILNSNENYTIDSVLYIYNSHINPLTGNEMYKISRHKYLRLNFNEIKNLNLQANGRKEIIKKITLRGKSYVLKYQGFNYIELDGKNNYCSDNTGIFKIDNNLEHGLYCIDYQESSNFDTAYFYPNVFKFFQDNKLYFLVDETTKNVYVEIIQKHFDFYKVSDSANINFDIEAKQLKYDRFYNVVSGEIKLLIRRTGRISNKEIIIPNDEIQCIYDENNNTLKLSAEVFGVTFSKIFTNFTLIN